MRSPFRVLPALFVALPLVAQHPQTVEALGDRVDVTHNAGLVAGADAGTFRGAGAWYAADFAATGMRFTPALGRAVPTTQHLALTPLSVGRGEWPAAVLPSQVLPEQKGLQVTYAHSAGVHEHYDVGPDGVELSWTFAAQPAGQGDLVVRYAVDTTLPQPVAKDGGLRFVDGDLGGVAIGAVTGIDARGVTVRGDARWVGGALELSLPEAFVATATYPIVLDPTVGAVFPVNVDTFDDDLPDVAFDATTGRYLVAWVRTFSAASALVRCQLVSSTGSLVGSVIFAAGVGVAERPRVANLGTRDRFGVAYAVTNGTSYTVEFLGIDAGAGTIDYTFTVASSTSGSLLNADIGCQTDAAIGQARGFVVAYDDNDNGRIAARRIYFNAADTLVAPSAFAVFTNSTLATTYSEPEISRTASADGSLLVVARRSSILVGSGGIVAAVVNAGSSSVGATVTVHSFSSDVVSVPDVDGSGGKWVCAWQQSTSGGPNSVQIVPVQLDAAATTLTVGPATGIGGSALSQCTAPSVGYTGGKTWIGYHLQSVLIGTTHSLRAVGYDSGTCVSCSDSFSEAVASTDTRIVATPAATGGITSNENALAVWGEAGDISAQRLINHTNGGGIANLGGACGAGGSQTWSHNPAIGSSGIVCTVNGLSANALATIFNFTAQGTTIPCGPCSWLPFSVTLTPPIVAGSAKVEFPIPCLLSLVGQQFQTQWTTIDFSQSPCPTFPGLAISDRSQLTIGN